MPNNSFSLTPLSTGQPWPRKYLVSILQAGLWAQDYRFTRQTALYWLASFPGDLPVNLVHAQALLGEGHFRQAEKVAQKLCQHDPEYQQAQEFLAGLANRAEPKSGADFHGGVVALGSNALHAKGLAPAPEWAQALRLARKSLAQKNFPRAESQAQAALAAAPEAALAALTHLQILAAQPETPRSALQSLAAHYHERWPECVQFILLLADALMDSGDADQGVALLHKATVYDTTGQVAERIWGGEHPYRALWPTALSAVIEIPIPAGVAAVLGWNLLASAQGSDAPSNGFAGQISPVPELEAQIPEETQAPTEVHQPKSPERATRQTESASRTKEAGEFMSRELPETLRSVQTELERIGDHLRQPGLAHSDGRFPTYVILTTRQGLRKKYGRAILAMIDAAIQELATTVRRRPDWGAVVFYADDPACTATLGTKPAQAEDPWALKLALADLDAALGKQGAMIGAVLIVGGPQVVPFHHLPNPTDDGDADVPSDNPYATRDNNYFIPEWPVGRLPGAADHQPRLLLGAIQAITYFHANHKIQTTGWWAQLWAWLRGFMHPGQKAEIGSFGYSAEVWQKASLAVYQQIGGPNGLVTSPPISVETRGTHTGLPIKNQLGYFNLHGLANTGEWYGQRDPSNGSQGPDYPVALRVQDIKNGGAAPEIIFSEACYGAYVIDKTAGDSMALRFLEAGTRALVGSTVMSYGSISTPLNAADLLGVAFWKHLKNGSPAGEALRRAKIHLAREMHKRQGYLDGEDQKTLISFILLGDPLAQYQANSHRAPKAVLRGVNPPAQVKTICDKVENAGAREPIPDDVMRHVKQVVAQYLPGMQGADITLCHEHADCNCKGHNCPTSQLGPKVRPVSPPERRVVTLSKSIPSEQNTHQAYARLTLDKQGKVVKLAVSR